MFFFFFNDTATTEIYTLSLHDALPICPPLAGVRVINALPDTNAVDVVMIDQVEWSLTARNINFRAGTEHQDRKSTRLNSSHANISYAVFCLKKKKKNTDIVFYFTCHTL